MRHVNIFRTWLLQNTVCNPSKFTLNREHVIPRSVTRTPSISNTDINVIPFPSRLNSARGNRRYDEFDGASPVWPCQDCYNPECPLLANRTRDSFSPPVIYRPIIAASILRTVYNNPGMVDVVHWNVIDMGLALKWVNDSYESLPDDIKEIFKV